MGLEITHFKRVETDPLNTTNWTNRRNYFWDKKFLFTYEVRKNEYRKPPLGFRLEWTSFKNPDELAAAAFDFYSALKSRYGFPKDQTSLNFTSNILSLALFTADQLEDRGLLSNQVLVGRSTLEPIYVQLTQLGKDSRNLFYCNEGEFDLDLMKDEFAPIFASADFGNASINTPFGVVAFEGRSPRGTRRVSMESGYKIPNEVLRLYQTTGITPIGSHQRSAINERLRKPISLLPKPNKAA